jgi:hypothetical protein
MNYNWYWGKNSKKHSSKNKKFIHDLLLQINRYFPKKNIVLISENIELLTSQFLNLADFFQELHKIVLSYNNDADRITALCNLRNEKKKQFITKKDAKIILDLYLLRPRNYSGGANMQTSQREPIVSLKDETLFNIPKVCIKLFSPDQIMQTFSSMFNSGKSVEKPLSMVDVMLFVASASPFSFFNVLPDTIIIIKALLEGRLVLSIMTMMTLSTQLIYTAGMINWGPMFKTLYLLKYASNKLSVEGLMELFFGPKKIAVLK